jgi:hypothetical protein
MLESAASRRPPAGVPHALVQPYRAAQDPAFAASAFAKQIALIEKADAAGHRGGNWAMRPDGRAGHGSRHRDILDGGRRRRLQRAPGPHKDQDVLDGLVALSRVAVHIRGSNAAERHATPAGKSTGCRETGWTPSIPLARNLSDLLDYWRKELQ